MAEIKEWKICLKENRRTEIPDELSGTLPALAVVPLAKALGIHERAQETLLVVCWDFKNEITGYDEIQIGTSSGMAAGPKEIMQFCLLNNAENFALVHNHPTSDATPSDADREFTGRLKAAGKLMQTYLIASYTIAPDGSSELITTE